MRGLRCIGNDSIGMLLRPQVRLPWQTLDRAISMSVKRVNRKLLGYVSFSLVILLTCARGFSEIAMMVEYGSDAQTPIWVMAMIFSLCAWFTLGVVCAAAVTFAWSQIWIVFPALSLYFTWMLAICMASGSYLEATTALADASDPLTRPERLHELATFSGIQAGYRLDNRIAVHPNTHPDDLRWLYHRGQYGTLLKLASNPNTPDDILEELAEKGDALIAHSLRLNPRLRDRTATENNVPALPNPDASIQSDEVDRD